MVTPTSFRSTRLLVTTQVVDADHPGLGFFHHWLEELALRFERIEVVCLEEGRHALPENVRVHSLGKEKGRRGKLEIALKFYHLAWKLRKDYDAVFVHMNPEYLLVAADLWKFSGKRIGLWYNHEVGSLALQLAAPFADIIFHTSPYAYTARYKKARQMPAGIDTALFSYTGAAREAGSIYFQGRVAPAKRVHVLCEALRLLREKGTKASVTVVGPEDEAYVASLRRDFADLIDAETLRLLGPRRNEATPALYSSHEVAVNLTADGNFDKTVLEAMACETPVIVGSKAFAELVPETCILKDVTPAALADALTRVLSMSESERGALGKNEREKVAARHGLPALADALAREMNYPAGLSIAPTDQ